MSDKIQKNLRLSPKAVKLLKAATNETGASDTRIIELCLACYALGLGVEVKRAKQFLSANLAEMVAATPIHRPAAIRTKARRKAR